MEEQFLNSIVVNQFRVETISSFDFATKRSCHFFPHRSGWTIGTTKLVSFVSYKIVDLSSISKNACTFESIRLFPFSISFEILKYLQDLFSVTNKSLNLSYFWRKKKDERALEECLE